MRAIQIKLECRGMKIRCVQGDGKNTTILSLERREYNGQARDESGKIS